MSQSPLAALLLDSARAHDSDVVARLRLLASREREAMAEFLVFLRELDERRLFVPEGFASAFAFLTEGLRLSEGAAARRLTAARCSRKFPEVLDHVRAGRLNLSTLALVAKHLRPENVVKVLGEVAKLTHRGVEQYVAREFEGKTGAFAGQDTIRFYAERPTPNPAPPAASVGVTQEMPSTPALSVPAVSHVRARISFSADESLVQKIEEIRGMMGKGHRAPALEEVFERLAEEYLERHSLKRRDERAKVRKNKMARPASASALAPPAPAARPKREALRADVARAVRVRDGYRCTFVSNDGVRCSETRGLEIDHVRAVALGGAVNDLENARLRCKGHNAFAAIEAFGPEFMARWVRPVGIESGPPDADPIFLSVGDRAAGALKSSVDTHLKTR